MKMRFYILHIKSGGDAILWFMQYICVQKWVDVLHRVTL